MRTFRAVSLGAIVAWLVGVVITGVAAFFGLVAEPGPHQLFAIAAIATGLAIAVVGTAIVFAIVLALGGRGRAIRWTTIVLVLLLLLLLAAPVIFGLLTTDPADLQEEAALAGLVSFLATIAVAALAVVLIEWQVVVRRLGLSGKAGTKVT